MKTSHTFTSFFLAFLFPGLLFASSLPSNLLPTIRSSETKEITRNDFPRDFIFGAGSASYQYEGAVAVDGRKPSTWDNFTHQYPEKISDGSNGDIANDFYHRYKDDIKSMVEIGLDSFRFSISWSRILPTGKLSGGINKLGVQFYHNLIDELLANGIKPFVTIFHWDMPQALQEEYGGFLSRYIVSDFVDYANLLFKEYGAKVQYWTTLNEPDLMTNFAYATGDHAPGRCSNFIGNCSAGDSAIEPYIVAHNALLCHAHTVKLYRTEYAYQNGMIGLTAATNMYLPINNTRESIKAAYRAMDFAYGWFLDPIVFGKYPYTMRRRLPRFTREESALLRQSFDFIGLNYYTANYVEKSLSNNRVNLSYTTDSQTITSSGIVNQPVYKDGVPIGEPTPSTWLYIYPEGIKQLLEYMQQKYNNPLIFITENGVGQLNNGSLAEDPTILQDDQRIRYLSSHLTKLHDAIRMGLVFVDDDLTRYPKDSYYWYKNFLTKKSSMANA
ncbi:hypothetical protein V2J09_010228 [Rumex salicifolius]